MDSGPELSPTWTVEASAEAERHTPRESDEYLQHVCDLCLEDEQCVEATAFCIICLQYLCNTCHKSHSRIQTTKQHKLLIGKDMPEKELGAHVKPKCKQHLDKILEYFCKDHKTPCCSTCQRLNHRNCKRLIKFADLDRQRNFRNECKQKLSSMQYLLGELQRLEHIHDVQISGIEAQKDNLIKAVKKTRKKVDQHLDKIEADIECTIRSRMEDGTTVVDKRRGDVRSVLEELSTQIKDFQDVFNTMSSDQEVMMAVQMESEIQKYSTIINEIHANSSKFEIKLITSKEINEISTHIVSFGGIGITKTTAYLLQPLEQRELVYLQDIDISSTSDEALPQVQTLEVLPNGSLLVCDASNKTIKMFDSNFEFMTEIKLSALPQSMAMFDSTDGMIAFPSENCVQGIKIPDSSSLKLGKKYKTKDIMVEQISKYEDDMIALADDSLFWYLYTMDRKGQLSRCLKKEPKLSQLFQSPITIHASHCRNIIYFVDVISGCCGISQNGDVLFQNRNTGGKRHVGICTISDNLACISTRGSDEIMIINTEGKHVKSMPALKGLETLTYSETLNKLFAENTLKRSVSIFTLI